MGKSQSRNKNNRSSLILRWTLAVPQAVLCFTFNINFSSPSRSPKPLLLIMAAPSPSSGFKSTGPPPTPTNAVCLRAMRWYQFSLCLAALSCYPSPLGLLGLLLCPSLTLSAPVFLPAALLLLIHPAQPCQSDSAKGIRGRSLSKLLRRKPQIPASGQPWKRWTLPRCPRSCDRSLSWSWS